MLRPKQAIVEMEAYAAPDEGRMNYARLDFNENTGGTSPKVLDALRQITIEKCGCYPEYDGFIQRLSVFLAVRPENVLPTNGSDEAIRALFDTYVENGDEVVLLSPSYSLYETFAEVAGAKIKWVLYGRDFFFPIKEVLDAISPNTRLIALANPNNPTGTLIAREDLLKILDANPSMVVLLDEAYTQFAQATNIDLIDRYANLFVTQTFSKAYGLAGFRIGSLISSRPNIEMVSKVISPAYSVNRMAMLAATAAMNDPVFFERYIEETIPLRQEFSKDLSALGFEVVPSAANFVLAYFGAQAEAIRNLLSQNNILVRARSEESLKGYLRITIGTKEQMQKVMDILKTFRASRGSL